MRVCCSFTSTTSAGGADGQARLSQENSHALATFPGGSTPPLEATVAEVTNTLKVSGDPCKNMR